MVRAVLMAFLCWSMLVVPSASAQSVTTRVILYGADGALGTPSNLYVLSGAGGGVIRGPIGFAVTGLAVHPLTGVLYGSVGNADGLAPGSLLTIDKATGQGTVVGSFGLPGETMADLTFTSDGTLYGWAEGNADDLYTVDVTTGLATLVGNSGIDTRGSGLAANSANVLFFTGDDDDGVLRTIDRFTGLPTTVATLNGTFGDPINALAFGPGDALYGVLSHSGPTRPSELIIINTVTGAISRLGPSIDRLDAIAFELEPIPPIPTLSDAAFVVLAGSLAAVALYRMRRARRT